MYFVNFVSDFRASDFLYTGGEFYDRINWNETAEGAENLDSCNAQNGNPDIQTELLWLHHASTRTGSSTSLLKLLLQDRTTGRNILWGTDACADRGGLYRQDQQIRPELITGPNAEIIVRNLWQMNGLSGTVPGYVPEIIEEPQLVMDELADLAPQPLVLDPTAGTAVPCRIKNWRQRRTLEYREVNQGGKRIKMKFDFVIGNARDILGLNAEKA